MIDDPFSLLYTQQAFGVVVIVTCLLAFAALIYDVEHREKIRRLTQKPVRGKIKSMNNLVLESENGTVVIPSSSLLQVNTDGEILEVMYKDEEGRVVTVEAYSLIKE